MIKWCAYCLHYLGEIEPYQNFETTHGVCESCRPKVLALTPSDQESLKPLQNFYRALRSGVKSGHVDDLASLVEESRRLAIRPLDLMMGMLQPMLVEIGELWVKGEVSVAIEHRFRLLARDLTAYFKSQLEPRTELANPSLLIFNAPGNGHYLGLQMADFFFTISDIPARVHYLPLPSEAILAMVGVHMPVAVGFSVAMPDQMGQVLELEARVKDLPRPPRHILVGGPVARLGVPLPPDSRIQVCRDLSEVQALVRRE